MIEGNLLIYVKRKYDRHQVRRVSGPRLHIQNEQQLKGDRAKGSIVERSKKQKVTKRRNHNRKVNSTGINVTYLINDLLSLASLSSLLCHFRGGCDRTLECPVLTRDSDGLEFVVVVGKKD